jgi:hypothetical protein
MVAGSSVAAGASKHEMHTAAPRNTLFWRSGTRRVSPVLGQHGQLGTIGISPRSANDSRNTGIWNAPDSRNGPAQPAIPPRPGPPESACKLCVFRTLPSCRVASRAPALAHDKRRSRTSRGRSGSPGDHENATRLIA